MAQRLPEPPDGIRPRLILTPEEFATVEDMAHELRLSTSGFIRAYFVTMMRQWGPTQKKAVMKTVEEMKELPPGQRRPGTQPKGEE